MQHPAFQSNPFETMQQHLRNSLAKDKLQLEQQSKERTEKEQATKAVKKERKKERLQATGGRHRKKFRATRKR